MVKKLQTISISRWASGLGFGLLVLAARLPDTIVVIHDAQGHSTEHSRFNPVMAGWTIGYILTAVGCILLGGRIALVIGAIMLFVGLFSAWM